MRDLDCPMTMARLRGSRRSRLSRTSLLLAVSALLNLLMVYLTITYTLPNCYPHESAAGSYLICPNSSARSLAREPRIHDSLSEFRNFKYSRKDVGTADKEDITYIEDIFIAIKTTGSYHKSRLSLLTETWITQAADSVRY